MADQINSPISNASEPEPEVGNGGSMYVSPAEFLRKSLIILTNTKADSGIAGVMAARGYIDKRIAEGFSLHEKVSGLIAGQNKEFGEQLEASSALKSIFEKAYSVSTESVRLARILFEADPKASTALGLPGARSKVLSAWYKQAETFYRNMLASADFMKQMETFGYTADKFKSEQKLVQDVMAADAKHKKEKGESQEATKVRDKALREFEVWMSTFKRVAKIACTGHDQWLEKLGIKEE